MTGTAQGVRERNRRALVAEIKAAATAQLAVAGAGSLSLRAIARELGMASSAIYRYFGSRDELLTALIVDAYDAVGASAERADAGAAGASPRDRWLAVGRATRAWAQAHPHQYALVYGSPVPDYQAPLDTIAPATRVTAVFSRILADAVSAGELASRDDGPSTIPAGELGRLVDVAAIETLMTGVPVDVMIRGLVAWTQLFGVISFELFGHLVGAVVDYDGFFDQSLHLMATFIGFP